MFTRHRIALRLWGARAAAPLALGILVAFAPDAQAADDFYKDKILTVAIASRPGGGTDTTARMVARFWSKHIPGNPEILIRNKPLQVLAGNDLQFNTRPDGLTVGVFAGGGSLGSVARKSENVKYDPTTWGIVGSIERGPSIVIIRKAALERFKDRSKPPVAAGSVSTDRPQDAIALFGSEYLGWNIKFVLGYPNSNQMYLAYERGEIDMFGSGTTSILQRFLKDSAVPVAAETARPDFPDVPTFDQMLGDKKPKGAEWGAFRAWAGPSSVDKYFATPPKTPDDRLAVLRDSFMKTAADPEFRAEAEKVLGDGAAALTGEDTLAKIRDAIIIPDEVTGVVKRLRAKYGLPEINKK